MIRIAVSALVVLSTAVPMFAQQRGDASFSVMATNISVIDSDRIGTEVSGGLVFGLNYWLTPRWSTQLDVTAERTGYPELIAPDAIRRVRTTTYPVDLIAQYHIPTGQSRWKPYVGLGAHYVGVPGGAMERSYDDLTGQVNAGTYLMISPRLGLRLDAKVLLRGVDAPWDDTFRPSAGLSWRF
jgi:outer membrane protein W